ncbi:uncharacterized protein PHALS_02582 [Plasmopara halstedii]|uniref:Uncharacterized protein n=1 Tax=Plasmopara halstedii TaxID=4781 RepID=A0A0P1AZ43_PLAHL|nr:uncharacterized protein PHALS_02582 [Plasmopara halstedii]CEG46166.1 hypothetical protein PHALS_02582 [Plasmopara halstedii]|eukprot:XP_024582535.1 hypothetical protein PHALS_02582 [Plasmopara halstedii]
MQYRTIYPYATTSQHNDAQYHSRDEQRRRQQEYFQALSQQVAQREQQKRLEREPSVPNFRHNDVVPHRQEAFELANHGIFDGLGQNHPQKAGNSYARRQPQPYQRMSAEKSLNKSQVDQYLPNAKMDLPSGFEPSDMHRPVGDPQCEVSGLSNRQQLLQPQQIWPNSIHKDSIPCTVGNELDGQAFSQNPSQSRTDQFWAEPGKSAMPAGFSDNGSSPQKFQAGMSQDTLNAPIARRRATYRNRGQGDTEEMERLRRKAIQQHEMQLALERQIEEKRQQKLEAKRKQDEEDRLELKRFEDDQRRLRAEQEQLEVEKRRKAELEQQKVNQLAAAVAAASLQAKIEQQQKLHAQIAQAQEHCKSSPQLKQIESSSDILPNKSLSKSRAHLYEDPQPQRLDPIAISNNNNQNALLRNSKHESGERNDASSFNELRRQYDDMREELKRQNEIVNQLRQAQDQMQQQQQKSSVNVQSKNVLMLEDLEILRNELREDLAHQEHSHRQKTDYIDQNQQLKQAFAGPGSESPEIKYSRELPGLTTMLPKECANSLRGDSTFVYFDTENENQEILHQEDEQALFEQSELIKVESVMPRKSNLQSEEMYSSYVEATTFDDTIQEEQEVADTDSEDDAVEFIVTDIASSSLCQPVSLSNAASRRASSHRYSQLPPAMSVPLHSYDHDKWRDKSVCVDKSDDSDEDLEETLDGDQLDALFQRNMRRHEIFMGFQSNENQYLHDSNCLEEDNCTKVAWTDQHQA